MNIQKKYAEKSKHPCTSQFEKSRWSVHDAKVNLVSLLNDPRKSKRDYDLFTKMWGETFRELPKGMLFTI